MDKSKNENKQKKNIPKWQQWANHRDCNAVTHKAVKNICEKNND